MCITAQCVVADTSRIACAGLSAPPAMAGVTENVTQPLFNFQFKNILLPFKTYTQQLYQGKKMTMRDSEA